MGLHEFRILSHFLSAHGGRLYTTKDRQTASHPERLEIITPFLILGFDLCPRPPRISLIGLADLLWSAPTCDPSS